MHQGCFVWTPTPPPSCQRTPSPGPVRVCVCVLSLAGSGGPASRARLWCASPSPVAAPGASLVCSAASRPGLPCLWLLLGFCFFFFFFFFLAPPPLSLAFRVFCPGVPWALARSGPPARPPLSFFFFFLSLLFRRLVRVVPLSPARGGVGLGVLWSSLPVRLFFFVPPIPAPPGFSFCFFLYCSCFFVCVLFFLFFVLPVCRFCGALVGLWVLRCGVCWCVLLWAGSRLYCVVGCSLVVPVLCVLLPVLWRCCGVFCVLPGAVWRACFRLGSCPLLPLPGPLSWPLVVFSPGVRCCVALVV